MTAFTPPPIFALDPARPPALSPLTRSTATRHATDIKAALDSLEDAIAALPDGDAKAGLKMRALRLHNQLARGGRVLNAHFQTAKISPDSAGGDKDGGGDGSQSS